MKRILPLLLILAGAIAPALAQSGTQADPLPLARGVNTPDFTAANSVFYTYTPATDEMLEFSNLSNVFIYTYQITPSDKRYGDTFNQATYVQTRAGVEYTVEVTKGYTGADPKFTFDNYASPWPDGSSWDTALSPSGRMGYLVITLDLPTYIKYTPEEDGVLSVFFTAQPTLKYSTSPDGEFSQITTSYQNGGGHKGSLEVTGGQTYYFTVTAPGSMLYRFEIIHPVTGESPEFPYTVNEGVPAPFPAKSGTYYYKIVNNGADNFLLIEGDGTFDGTARAGADFNYPSVESTGRIHLRMPVSANYTEYCLTLTRTADAAADQQFTATYSDEAYDILPGQEIEPGTHTTPDFGGRYYYTFTVPSDGRNIITVAADGDGLDAKTRAALYYADNHYSVLKSGSSMEYDAVAGRQYTLAWDVEPADAPLTFTFGFKEPAPGETPSNPIDAVIGHNSADSPKPVYFRYTATRSGRLYITPAEGLPMPAVSMLPIPSDPYTQACEVIADGDGYRVATTKDRGYLIMFNVTGPVSFDLAENKAVEGELPSNPFTVDGNSAAIPEAVGTYWFRYTAGRDGKLDISTDMPFEISENRQDYSFVRIYDPSDPDNFIAELRPDYDNGVFANRVLDTTEETVYLIKVRTMRAVKGYTLSMTVRDPIAGEIPELPIEIPFDGKKGTFAFDRMVNYSTDAIWYGITLPEGVFSMAGRSGGAFEMKMYAPGDLDTPVAEAAQIGIDYDEVNQMYIYVWGIADLEIPEAGRYLMHVTDNSAPFEVELSMLTEDGISTVGTDPAADVWYNLQGIRLDGRPTAPGIYIRNGRKTAVR